VLLHGGSEAWVTEGIDHGVVGGARLGQQSWEHGHQGSDDALVEEQTLYGDSAIRCPAEDPKTDVEDGYLSNTHLSALSLSARSQAGDVHLLGLGPHSRFVSSDRLDDEEVRVEDNGQRNNVTPDEDEDTVGLVVEVLRQVVGGAGIEDTFRKVSAPAEERWQRSKNAVKPDEDHHGSGFTEGEGLAGNSVDDDIVAVVGDEDQGPDGSESSHESTESVNTAVEGREHPHSTAETVVGEDWEVGDHHLEVEESKVGDQKIRRSLQLLHFHVQV